MTDLLKQFEAFEAKQAKTTKTAIEKRWLDEAKHDIASAGR